MKRKALHGAGLAGLALALALWGSITAAAGLTASTDFKLINHRGATVAARDLRGERYRLIYFGYTHCPDVCPLGLSTIAAALGKLGPMAARVEPIFITVDPERDTPARLARYVTAFHPRLLGLTGELDQIRIVGKALGAHFVVATFGGETFVDHSTATYLLGPDGTLAATFDNLTSPGDMAAGIAAAMRASRAH